MKEDIIWLGKQLNSDYFRDRFNNIYTIIDDKVFYTGSGTGNLYSLHHRGKLEPSFEVVHPTVEMLLKVRDYNDQSVL